MNENNNGRGIFYGVIGVATLVVAIIGATFAYFTASQRSNENDITGNAASISFGLSVTREETTDQTNGGLIPMSNSMVEQAVSVGGEPGVPNGTNKVACVDELGKSVCQIYKVTLSNASQSTLALDGYITLSDGLGTPTDVETAPTTMRWAQVFKTSSGSGTGYSTGGTTYLGADSGNEKPIAAITSGNFPVGSPNGHNIDNIYVDGSAENTLRATDINDTALFGGTPAPVIKRNYIRISSTSAATNRVYQKTELTDAFVFNQQLPAAVDAENPGEVELYFVVWLHESGLVQDPENPSDANEFFSGIVTFQNGNGGQVSATFNSIATAVPAGN